VYQDAVSVSRGGFLVRGAGTLSALAVPLDQPGERGKLLLDETTRRLVLESAPGCSSKRDAHLPTNTPRA
jgi:hypothetical protein